jgi:hypothetical protein
MLHPTAKHLNLSHVLPGKPFRGLQLTTAPGPLGYPVPLTAFRREYGSFHPDVTGVTTSSLQRFTEARNYSIASRVVTPR